MGGSSLLVGRDQDERFANLVEPAPAVELRPPRLVDPEQVTCIECHRSVVEEWAGTAHAIAWVDELYQHELTDKQRPELCHGCHIPEPVLAKGKVSRPKPRADARPLGIHCESCHLGPDGAMLGPRGTPTEAHASQRSEAFVEDRSIELCSVCHSVNIGPVVGIAKDFAASKQVERGRSCVGCHMAPLAARDAGVEGAAADPSPPVRSHAIQTPRDPAFLRLAFAARLEERGAASVLFIENRAGHRVPGLIGRRIVFRAELLAADGSVLERAEQTIDASRYIPVDGKLEVAFKGRGEAVNLVGLHFDPRQEESVTFLEERITREER